MLTPIRPLESNANYDRGVVERQYALRQQRRCPEVEAVLRTLRESPPIYVMPQDLLAAEEDSV